jgi:CDP-diacylglycerol--serine O-phosphatidyltransferase
VSFKGAGPRSDRVPFLAIIVVVAVLVAVAIDPPTVLLGVFSLYALSGLGYWVWRRLRRPAEVAA